MNPYDILGIDEEATLEELKDQLGNFAKFKDQLKTDRILSKEKLEKLWEGKTEEEQREIALDTLVEEKGWILMATDENKYSRHKYLKAASTIGNKKKREEYRQKQEELNKQGDEVVQDNMVEKNSDLKSGRVIKFPRNIFKKKEKDLEISNTMDEFMRRQKELGQLYTRKDTLLSGMDLKRKELNNKAKYDSKNQFRNFTGAPYRWAMLMGQTATFQDVQSRCLLDRENEKGEQVVVMNLGEFRYETDLRAPSIEHRSGDYAEHGFVNVFGVSKLDQDKNILKSSVVLGNLYNLNTGEASKNFMANRYFSDEWIENAIGENYAYIGSVVEDKQSPEGYKISCNEILDDKLMTALIWAENNLDVPGGYRKTFSELKEHLKGRQNFCVEKLLTLGKENRQVEEYKPRSVEEKV